MPTKNVTTRPPSRNRLRTLLASLCGVLAVTLLFVSVLLVWLNHKISDTAAYTATVGSLADKQEIQTFVSEKVSQEVAKKAPIQSVATTLLAPEQIAGKTPEQLQPLVKAKVYAAVLQIVRSPQFATVWKQTNQNAQQQLVAQLKSEHPQEVSLDLSPIITTLVDQLKQGELAPVSSALVVDPTAAKINLKGGFLDKAASYYRLLHHALVVLVVLVIALLTASVLISVHHLQTFRRILMISGLIALGLAIILQMPSFVPVGGTGSIEQKAMAQIARSLFRDLQMFCLWFGIGSIGVALATKMYSLRAKERNILH